MESREKSLSMSASTPVSMESREKSTVMSASTGTYDGIKGMELEFEWID